MSFGSPQDPEHEIREVSVEVLVPYRNMASKFPGAYSMLGLEHKKLQNSNSMTRFLRLGLIKAEFVLQDLES